MDLDTRHLRLIKAIADAGSISGAAPALGASQPAITRQLRRIENGLGGELFLRSRDGVAPTDLGRLVVGRADAALAIIDSLQADIESARAPEGLGRARVAARTGPLLLGLMKGLRAQVPAVEVTTESESRIGALCDLIAARQLDVALVREFVGFEIRTDPRILKVPVEIEDVQVVLSQDHPLAGREEVDVAELADQDWLLSPLDVDREADCVTAMCADAGFAPRIVHYVPETVAYELIRAGEAITTSLPRKSPSETAAVRLRGTPVRVRHVLLSARNGMPAKYVAGLVPHVRESLAAARARAHDMR